MNPDNKNRLLKGGILLVGALLCLQPAHALAKLSAEAELQYVNFDARNNAGQHLSAHSLTQNYSLLYKTEGNILDSRMGKYNLALGYGWSTFDTKMKSTSGTENPQGNKGHVIYQGEIVLDPKEVPFRFTAYSRDMSRIFFSKDGFRTNNDLLNNSILGVPSLATSLSGGTHIDSGATLVMGVKNGMTNGYNELLRHFPMIMLDYSDRINRDYASTTPVDNRLSRLAFVSLNKKDNWFHYRVTTYDDYIDRSNSYKETQFQLGTVDQSLQRRWIDFANWLQISADGQLTKRTSALGDGFTEFNLNLFGIARRAAWEARTFNNFNRHKDEKGVITYRTTVPAYVSGTISADTSWNTHLSYNEVHDNNNMRFTDLSGSYRIDTFKRSPFTLSQQLDLETASSDNNKLLVVSGTLESASTSRFSRNIGLGGWYTIRNSSADNGSSTTNLLDQIITANASYSPSNQTRLRLTQMNRLTRGTSKYFGSTLQGAVISSPQYVDPRNNSSADGTSSFQSTTDLTFDWNPLPRLNIGFSLNEDIYKPDNSPTSYKTNFVNTLDFSNANLKLTSKNTFTIDNSAATLNTSGPATSSYIFSSYNRAEYTFNRNLNSRVGFNYNKSFNNSDESDALNVSQEINYYYYKTSGFNRKYFEINEAIDYTDTSSSSGNSSISRSRNATMSLGGTYYPLKQLTLAAGSKYTFRNSFNDYSLIYYGSLGLSFRLFQASIDYTYGTAKQDGRIEKRLTANFRKSF